MTPTLALEMLDVEARHDRLLALARVDLTARREVRPALLSNVRLLGANRWQLIRIVYLPAALGWVCSSLSTVIGLAFVGVVVGEYLGSTRGIGYLIMQAEATFDVNTVLAGIIVLTCCALLFDALLARLERRLSA